MAKLDKSYQKPAKRIDTLKKIEIPEGVEISIRVAGPVTRSSALAMDLLIMFGALLLMLVVFEWMGALFGDALAEGFRLILFFLIYWFYFIFFESGKRGATPGKRAMKLRVVMSDGTPAPLSAICIRNMLKPIDMMPMFTCGLGLFTCLMTSKFQRLGDLAAGTVVVHVPQENTSRQQKTSKINSRAPMVPLTHEEQSAIVSFKDRHQQWGPLRSEELAGIVEPVMYGQKDTVRQASLRELAEVVTNDRTNQSADRKERPRKYHHLLEIGEWIQRGEQTESIKPDEVADPEVEALTELSTPIVPGVG